MMYTPRQDSPSVLSNRVFAIRRINKMEAQRLGLQLNTLDAEVMQTKNMIAQKQQALKKELAQIHEVKNNPAVGIERRKLQRQLSSKPILMGRQRLAGDTQGAQTLFRSFSTSHLPMQGSRGFTVHGKERKLGTLCQPLSTVGETLTGTLSQRESIFDNHTEQEMSNDRLPASATEKKKFLRKSVSTGTSRTPSLLESARNFYCNVKGDNFIVASARNRKFQMLGNCQGKKNLDLNHYPKLAWKEKNKIHRNLPETKDLTARNVHDSTAPSCIRHKKGATRDEPNEQGLSLKVLSRYSYTNPSTRKTQKFWDDNPRTSLECQLSSVSHISAMSGELNACEKSISAGNEELSNSNSSFFATRRRSLSAPTSPR